MEEAPPDVPAFPDLQRPGATQNRSGERDPERPQSEKGNRWIAPAAVAVGHGQGASQWEVKPGGRRSCPGAGRLQGPGAQKLRSFHRRMRSGIAETRSKPLRENIP